MRTLDYNLCDQGQLMLIHVQTRRAVIILSLSFSLLINETFSQTLIRSLLISLRCINIDMKVLIRINTSF